MGLTGKKGRKPSYFRRLAQTSLILSGLGALQEKLFRFPGAGCGGPAAKRPDRLLKSGFSARLSRRRPQKAPPRLKCVLPPEWKAAGAVRLYRTFVDVSAVHVHADRSGVFITFGLYSVFVAVAKSYTGPAPVPLSDVLPGALCVVAGLPFVGCVEPVSAKLRGSGIYTLVFVNLLGVEGNASGRPARPKTYGAAAVIAGTLLGTLSFVVPAGRIIFYAFLVLLCMVILHSPESGLLLVLLTFPFTGAASSFFILAAFISYFQKLARGKTQLSLRSSGYIFPAVCRGDAAACAVRRRRSDTPKALLFKRVFAVRQFAEIKQAGKKSVRLLCGGAFGIRRAVLPARLGFFYRIPVGRCGGFCAQPSAAVGFARAFADASSGVPYACFHGAHPAVGVCGVVLLAMDVCALIYTRSNVIWYSALFTAFAFFALVYGKRLLTSLLGIGVLSLAAVGFGELAVRLGYAYNGFCRLFRFAARRRAGRRAYHRIRRRAQPRFRHSVSGFQRLVPAFPRRAVLSILWLALITVSVTAARAFLLPESREGGARAAFRRAADMRG